MTLQVELRLEGLVDRLDDLAQWPQETLPWAGLFGGERRTNQGGAVITKHCLEFE